MSKTFDEVYPGLPSGWLDEGEAHLLWDEAGRTEGPILEVGCYKGRSTCLLAALGRPLYCVDPFDGFDSDDPDGTKTMKAWYEAVKSRGIRGRSVLDWDGIPEDLRESASVWIWPCRIEQWEAKPVGFAYLDGDHTYQGTKAQVEKALLCSPQTIAVHDVNDSGGGKEVKAACSVMLGPWTQRVGRLAVWSTWRGK